MSARPIPESMGARYPCWSPDSQNVAFVVAGQIRKASVQGSNPTPVASLPADVGGSGGIVWTPSGHFIVAGGDNTGILQVPVQGGEFKEILAVDQEKDVDFHEISLLPNGEDLVFVVHRKDSNAQVRLVDTLSIFANGKRKDVLRLEGESIQSVVYSPPGYLLFHRSRTTPGVWALPFSLAELEATGEPFLVAADSWLPSASRDGTLLLVHGLGLPMNELVQVDRQGTVLGSIGRIEGDGEAPHLSPDGRRLAMTVAEDGNWDLWIYDLERATRSRFTFESTFDVHARWSPAGDEILYSVADMRVLKLKRVDGSDEARTVGEGLAPDWIPDGSGFIFEHYSEETDNWNISYKLFDEEQAVPLLATSANEISPRISPDGRYFLYTSDETGDWEVYVRPFPDGDGKWQVSTAGGTQPLWARIWARNSREIFYPEGESLMAVDVIDSDEFALGRPTKLMQTTLSFPIFDSGRFSTFEVGPDGQSFFLVRAPENGTSPNRLMLIENWLTEFEDPR
jgi:serine/threonine-protein kinase